MKSTGLFGKNSGRVGGVVYSNYRGEQVVRTYQPQVKNPNSRGQVEQRAKFKLVSQVGASLGEEIAMSFVPNVAKESPRNAFVKAMLKKASYIDGKATLPIEEIALTNSIMTSFLRLVVSSDSVSGTLRSTADTAKVRIVLIAYNEGGTIQIVDVAEPTIIDTSGTKTFTYQIGTLPSGYYNYRALVYSYDFDQTSGSTYDNYEVMAENATLEDVLKMSNTAITFYSTSNVLVPQNV